MITQDNSQARKTPAPDARSPARRRELLKLSEVSIWLDTYDDIFSDFDPRPYSERGLSDDFAAEAARMSKSTARGGFELKFLLPQKRRNAQVEQIITRRLIEYYGHRYADLRREIGKSRRDGLILTSVSVTVMLFGAFLPMLKIPQFLANLILVIIEPGSWFMIWNGLDQVFFEPKKRKNELEYLRKMSECDIRFIGY